MAGVELTGEIAFDPTAPPFEGAVVHVLLEDTSLADAPAVLVARLDLDDVSWHPGDGPLRFTLPVPELDEASTYTVRVHADIGRTGLMEVGDQITVESYPVLTQGSPSEVSVQLRRIG